MRGVPNAPRPSPTLASLGPSHQWCHKSRASLQGPPCAQGVAGTPQREVRNTRIFYVYGDELSQRACLHLGHYSHLVKVGDYRHNRKKIDALIEEYVDQTPQATVNKIVMETSKDLLGQYLICNYNELLTILSLNELEPIFDSCKELNSLSLQN